MPFIIGIAILFAYQFIGEVCVILFDLPIPAPVVGMFLLFITLLLTKKVYRGLQKIGDGLLRHLSLFFIPPAVGVIEYMGWLYEEWFWVGGVVIISNLLMVIITALILHYSYKRLRLI